MAKSKAKGPVYTRWGAPHRTYTTKKFELYRNDPTQGFSYNAQELTSDYYEIYGQQTVYLMTVILKPLMLTFVAGLYVIVLV